ncbi:hypothetical protein AWM75_00705 [Aerococcus urinaehominis]|uniref:Uncharacterized protein n=1 Tax=Aerococcus urinaehominis TaxID=128944 RepID=A0A109RGH9_9LACT|nr:hypothetical protein [Aerococcus urinaehominis]AMB98601.1 hypothetical protein AWM75_00705 [Aerococcus urinaehominis]SDL76177.1 hypothetical protein SAMN04487985_1013 [Aerococcus urinaehominis]
MQTYRTRKQGNSITITVPKDLNVEAGQEFVVIQGEGGSFTYIPKLDDIFLIAEENNLDLRPTEEVWEDDYLSGHETI